MDENRSCFHCALFGHCWLRLEINRVLITGELRIINIDNPKYPAKYSDIFVTLGNACMIFKPKK